MMCILGILSVMHRVESLITVSCYDYDYECVIIIIIDVLLFLLFSMFFCVKVTHFG